MPCMHFMLARIEIKIGSANFIMMGDTYYLSNYVVYDFMI